MADIYGDKCAFRIVYDGEHHAYRIMPISSGNGIHRAIAKDANSNNVVLLNNTIHPKYPNILVDTTRLLFIIELQSDGSFVIKLHANTALILTDKGDGNTVTLETPAQTGVSSAQKWTFSTYQYIMPDGAEVPYTEFENRCRSLGFGNPFGANPEISLVVTSDFGARWISDENPKDFHKGLDIRTKPNKYSNDYIRNLYSPYSGTVVEVHTADTGGAGVYVKIDTGIPAYEGSKYTICIVYMHMKEGSIAVSVDDTVTPSTLLGQSGDTGNVSPHLHYGVFLHNSDPDVSESYSPNDYPLNPLMFFTPDGFVNGKQ